MSAQRRRQQQRQEQIILDNTYNSLTRMLYESNTGYLVDSQAQQQSVEASIANAAGSEQLLDTEFSKYLHSSQAAISAKYVTRHLDVKSMTLSIVRRTK